MTLAAPAAVPPIVFAVAPLMMFTPYAVAELGRAVLVGADEVAQHHVARHAGAEDHTLLLVLPDMTLPAPAAVPPIVFAVAPFAMSTPSCRCRGWRCRGCRCR